MEKNYNYNLLTLVRNFHFSLIFLFMCVIPGALLSQQSYTFTNCGVTGSVGPLTANTTSAYLSTNLNGSVTVLGGVQSFTIPYTGNWRIRAVGAAGGTQLYSPGYPGGTGASMQGDFAFTGGTVLKIIVGQKGGDTQGIPQDNAAPGGGGGSFVYTLATSPLPLIAAGGGGGGGRDAYLGFHASITTTGNAAGYGGSGGAGLGGVNGNGGQSNAGGSSYWAGGGAGWLTDGTGGNNVTNYSFSPGTSGAGGGRTPANGAAGGVRWNDGIDEGGDGGFGGGGGGGSDNMGCGGGGGFSGGGGSNYGLSGNPPGGGGGSINTGTNQINTGTVNAGHGYVILTELCNIKIYSSGSNSVNPSICSGSSLTLTTNAVSPYTWFNGNTTNTAVVVSPTVTTTYSIVGTSTAACQASAFITVTVSGGLPVLAIANPSSNICLGRTVSLTASGALTYTWTGGVVNGQTFTPASTQNYTVQGQNGCGISTAVTAITVAPLPVSTLATPSLVCMGYPSTLTAVSSVGGYTWQPVALYGSSVVVAPMANTIYTVTASDGTCSGTQTLAITTKVTPTITASASNSAICQGQSVVLTANGGSTYNWTPGNLSGNSITVTPLSSTLYGVDGTNGVGCTASANQVILVTGSPTLNIVANKTTVCAGDAVNLFASGATTYTWTNGPSTSGYTVNPTSSTVYTVSGNQGTNICVGSKTIAIAAIISNVTISSNTAVCPGGTATLTAGGATSYTWNGVPMGGNGSFQVTPSSTTIYTCVANTTSGSVSCPTTKTVQVAIFPNPTITVVATKSLICKAQSNTLTATGAVTYSWGAAGAGSVIVVKPNTTTIYSVNGIDANGCSGSQLISVIVNACLGISEINSANQNITVFPNPNTGEFTIETTGDSVLRLLNSIGQELKVLNLTESNNHQANVKDLANGVYFLVGENAGGKVNQKIVVAK
ncbi:MAG: T9SS type A sorting domain-containing protein [bacterium]|nr:T9SS type A sorting domain-containing protein [bacterium]